VSLLLLLLLLLLSLYCFNALHWKIQIVMQNGEKFHLASSATEFFFCYIFCCIFSFFFCCSLCFLCKIFIHFDLFSFYVDLLFCFPLLLPSLSALLFNSFFHFIFFFCFVLFTFICCCLHFLSAHCAQLQLTLFDLMVWCLVSHPPPTLVSLVVCHRCCLSPSSSSVCKKIPFCGNLTFPYPYPYPYRSQVPSDWNNAHDDDGIRYASRLKNCWDFMHNMLFRLFNKCLHYATFFS